MSEDASKAQDKWRSIVPIGKANEISNHNIDGQHEKHDDHKQWSQIFERSIESIEQTIENRIKKITRIRVFVVVQTFQVQ